MVHLARRLWCAYASWASLGGKVCSSYPMVLTGYIHCVCSSMRIPGSVWQHIWRFMYSVESCRHQWLDAISSLLARTSVFTFIPLWGQSMQVCATYVSCCRWQLRRGSCFRWGLHAMVRSLVILQLQLGLPHCLCGCSIIMQQLGTRKEHCLQQQCCCNSRLSSRQVSNG